MKFAIASIALIFALTVGQVSGDLFGCDKHHDNCHACTSNSNCFYNGHKNKCDLKISEGIVLLTDPGADIPIPFDCPKETPSEFAYTDDFGRNRALIFAAASNGDGEAEVQPCLTARVPSAQFDSQYTFSCDWLSTQCSGYIALNPEEKAIVVTFRGTKGLDQFALVGLDLLFYGSSANSVIGGRVFTYFNNAFQILWGNGVQKRLTELKAANPDYELWVFGHSLGGSLAALAAASAVKEGIFESHKVKQVTMGEPRTGDAAWAEAHDALVPNTYRIIHHQDPIPKFPIKLIPSQTNAYHHRYEVWYDNDMSQANAANFAINLRADDRTGANADANIALNNDHTTYFDIDMDSYYLSACPPTP